ncbi:hypothetical protein GGS20DRAFT_277514 [Poronia punctata]|nr:hypothetical protein GGS20DRAFT_277514 [Poronia punctata]
MVDMGMANARGQTTSGFVSLAHCGRDGGSSQPQYSNKASPGNWPVFFHGHPTANAYAQDLPAGYSQPQFQRLPYQVAGPGNPNMDVVYQSSPSLRLSPGPCFARPDFTEPDEYGHVSPAPLNSSFSSATSMPGLEGHEWINPVTISPKMLRINPSPTPKSSSESLGIEHDQGIRVSALDEQGTRTALPTKCWNQEASQTLPLRSSDRRDRKELPTQSVESHFAASPSRKVAPSKGKGGVYPHQSHVSVLRPLDVAVPKTLSDTYPSERDESPAETVAGSSGDAERKSKDQLLIDLRRAGFPYRDIRIRGQYPEAESTLRGRFRTLTKAKHERYGNTKGVPWKKVAAYIKENGGSYHFGNATCRKKWDELKEDGQVELP